MVWYGMVHMSHGMVHVSIDGRPKLPQKLLGIAVVLLHSDQHSDILRNFIQGMAKSCHDCTHPWERARMGLGGVLDCCDRQTAIPEIAGCCLLQAQGDAWLMLPR